MVSVSYRATRRSRRWQQPILSVAAYLLSRRCSVDGRSTEGLDRAESRRRCSLRNPSCKAGRELNQSSKQRLQAPLLIGFLPLQTTRAPLFDLVLKQVQRKVRKRFALSASFPSCFGRFLLPDPTETHLPPSIQTASSENRLRITRRQLAASADRTCPPCRRPLLRCQMTACSLLSTLVPPFLELHMPSTSLARKRTLRPSKTGLVS